MSTNSLTVTDNRTGRNYDLPIENETIRALELRKIKVNDDDFGLMTYDPRARIIKKVAYEVFEVTGKDPLLDIALELERIALEDEYFVKRKLYPNVDFYSGIIYQAMRFPVDMFPVLFAIPRTSGWLAQWAELLDDQDQKIARPRQVYLGERARAYLPLAARNGQKEAATI